MTRILHTSRLLMLATPSFARPLWMGRAVHGGDCLSRKPRTTLKACIAILPVTFTAKVIAWAVIWSPPSAVDLGLVLIDSP